MFNILNDIQVNGVKTFCPVEDVIRQKDMQCSDSGKKCTKKSSLKTHMQLHTEGFRYYCEFCGKGIITSWNFKTHIRGHKDLRYHCEFCSKSYMDQQKLKYHLSVHTGQFKFRCETCGKGFNTTSAYKVHIGSHLKLVIRK